MGRQLREAAVRVSVARATRQRRLGCFPIAELKVALRRASQWAKNQVPDSPEEDRALEYVQEAAKDLALALLQVGRPANFQHFPTAQYRFSDAALRFKGLQRVLQLPRNVAVLDHKVPDPLFRALRRSFSNEFWKAHNYKASKKPRSYFSYVHDLRDEDRTWTSIYARFLLKSLAREFPMLKKARYAEWWVHRRPPCAAHQLHFDSDDEGRGIVRHPIASTILYFDDVGGPTLMTQQRSQDAALQQQGTLVFPTRGRILAFDGTLLHAVMPALPNPKHSRRRRTTLMMAFWDDLNHLSDFDERPCAAVKFPLQQDDDDDEHKWLTPFFFSADLPTTSLRPTTPRKKSNNLIPNVASCSPLWEPLFPDESDDGDNRKAIVPLPPYDAIFQGF